MDRQEYGFCDTIYEKGRDISVHLISKTDPGNRWFFGSLSEMDRVRRTKKYVPSLLGQSCL